MISVNYNDQDPTLLSLVCEDLSKHLHPYQQHFKSRTHSQTFHAQQYLAGLIKTERRSRNIECMHQTTGTGDYQALHHFVSGSVWDPFPLMRQVAEETADLFASPQGGVSLQIDESGHMKKGKASVGVARQYAGVSGKVGNCQIGVYASLVHKEDFSLINSRIYLPKEWTSDPARCEKAGIPPEQCSFKTKPQLALEMVWEAYRQGLIFDWVGGDSVYGNSPELIDGLEQMGLKFVLDVNGDKHVYLQEPDLLPPEPSSGRGRPNTAHKIEGQSICVLDYAQSLNKSQWELVKIRKTPKGWLKAWCHVVRVWVVPRKTTKIQARTLILRKVPGRKKGFKYSLTNFDLATTTLKKLVWMQGQRHFIEQAFRVAKHELGMSDYQVRKWEAWYKHTTMVMLAMLFMVKQKRIHQVVSPLTSLPDIRKLSQAMIDGDTEEYQKQLKYMTKRHQRRRADIRRHYPKDRNLK